MPELLVLLVSLAGPFQESDAARAKSLVDLLAAEEIETRLKAAKDLRALGEVAIPSLEAAAEGANPEARVLARRLLHEFSATWGLIDDLRSDDVPGNARSARAALQKRYGPAVRDGLLAALKSDDDQQAIEAAFLLAANRDAASALSASPQIVRRAAHVIVRSRDEGFRWVAAEAALQIGAAMTASAREEAWSKALADVVPWSLHECVLALHQVATRSKSPYPVVLMRRYLRNLMNDAVDGNAVKCRYVLHKIGAPVIPDLRAVLEGYDPQARAMAVDLLLEWDQSDLPTEALAEAIHWSTRARQQVMALQREAIPPLLRALRHQDPEVVREAAKAVVEIEPGVHDAELARSVSRLLNLPWSRWWKGEYVETILRRLGPPATAALSSDLADADPFVALTAARGLLVLDQAKYVDAVLARAERELADDRRRDNARRASQLLFELNEAAIPLLRSLLASGKKQTVVCAAAILARLGRLEGLPHASVESVLAYADGFDEADEPGALLELLNWSEPLRSEVKRRLARKGGSAAEALDVRLMDYDEDPWIVGRK